jgi:hypothetical protein
MENLGVIIMSEAEFVELQNQLINLFEKGNLNVFGNFKILFMSVCFLNEKKAKIRKK